MSMRGKTTATRPAPSNNGVMVKKRTMLAGRPQFRLKTTHTYPGANGKARVELFTPPQPVPTYMGGTDERGQGGLNGRVVYSPKKGDKVSHITVKVKCVALIRLPVVDASAPNPAAVGGRSPEKEKVIEKEVTLLQMEHMVWKSSGNDNKGDVFDPATVSNSFSHAELLPNGSVALRFQLELPRNDKAGHPLPPSFVFAAGEDAHQPTAADARRTEGLSGKAKELLSISLRDGVTPAPDRNHWANIKWYAKITIGHPGVLHKNDRILIPFQYLPPPPKNVAHVVERRARVGAELRRNVPFTQISEPARTWRSVSVGPDRLDPNRRKGFFALFARKRVVPSPHSIELPRDPTAFTIRGIVPFTIVSKLVPRAGHCPLSVGMYRRLTMTRNKDSQAYDERLMAQARIAPSPKKITHSGGTTYRWDGAIQLPPSAGPSFQINLLRLGYYIGIKGLGSSHLPTQKIETTSYPPPPAQFIHTIPLTICCPPARTVLDPQAGAITYPSLPPAPIHVTCSEKTSRMQHDSQIHAQAEAQQAQDCRVSSASGPRAPVAHAASLSTSAAATATTATATTATCVIGSTTAPAPTVAATSTATVAPSLPPEKGQSADFAPGSPAETHVGAYRPLPVPPTGATQATPTEVEQPANPEAADADGVALDTSLPPLSPLLDTEDELGLDLPPSYFEATGIRDEED